MPRLFRRATFEALAARGDSGRLLKALKPRAKDYAQERGVFVDLGWPRRRDAARHIAALPGEDVTDALFERLGDRSAPVQREAFAALAGRTHVREPELIATLLGWEAGEQRSEGAAALIGRADADDAAASRIVTAYISADTASDRTLDDDWVQVVFGAVDGKQRAVVLEAAAHAAAAGENPRAQQVLAADEELSIAILLERLESGQDRTGTVALLGGLRNATAAGPIAEQMRAADPRLRAAAAAALGHIQDPRAVEPLLHAAVDPVFDVRNAAQRALDALGTAGVVWSVAAAARGALDGAGQLLGTEETRRLLESGTPAD